MLEDLINWWAGQSGWLKYGFPLILLSISGIMYLNGSIWLFGWALGGVLLLGSLLFKDDPLA